MLLTSLPTRFLLIEGKFVAYYIITSPELEVQAVEGPSPEAVINRCRVQLKHSSHFLQCQ